MERRTFLSTLAVGAGAAGAGAIWLPGCGGPPAAALRPHEAQDLLGRLERGLGRVRSAPRREGAPDRVIRVGLEALVVADVARSIPAGTLLPATLAERLGDSLPILDDCVVAYHALLEEAPRAMRRKLDQTFRAKPAMAMDVAEQIDAHAGAIGISRESRIKLRRVAANVGARVRRQSAGALIDDCAAKMEHVVARAGGDLRAARSATTTALVHAIFQQIDGAVPGGGAAGALGAPGSPSAPGDVPPAPPAPVDQGRTADWRLHERPPGGPLPGASGPGDPELTVGGVMGGAGLAVFGIAGLVSLGMQTAFPLLVVATPAGVAVIIGLILLIVGGVQNSRG